MTNRDSFTALELAFFRAGEEVETRESFVDDEIVERPPSLLQRLFRRKPAPQ